MISAFRHALVQEAVYRAAPKRLRAELHERFIDRFEERRAGTGDLDEFAGYHLEQAYRLRTELGESDRRTAQLGEDAGRRLGEAGVRASMRADGSASIALLRRATSIPSVLPGTAKRASMRAGNRIAGCRRSRRRRQTRGCRRPAMASEDRKVEARARMERAYVRSRCSRRSGTNWSTRVSSDPPVRGGGGRPFARPSMAPRWLGPVAIAVNTGVRLEAAERALVYYRARRGLFQPPSVRSRTRCTTALRRCLTRSIAARAPATGDRHLGRANVEVFSGARLPRRVISVVREPSSRQRRRAYEELGQRRAMQNGSVLGEVDLLACDA